MNEVWKRESIEKILKRKITIVVISEGYFIDIYSVPWNLDLWLEVPCIVLLSHDYF